VKYGTYIGKRRSREIFEIRDCRWGFDRGRVHASEIYIFAKRKKTKKTN